MLTPPTTIRQIAPLCGIVLILAVALYLLNQVRKPTKWVGRFFLWIMNKFHSDLTDWGLEHVRIEPNFTILDVGCGGGRTIQKLASITAEGMVYGIDYANGSVAASRARNANLIEAGRVEIRQATVSQLPFPEDKFDLVTAVETQYYWPELLQDMQGIRRVLKPGGTLIIIAESYDKAAHKTRKHPVMKFLGSGSLSADDQQALFSSAGFLDIQIFEESTKGWICVTGKKPGT